MTASMEQQVSNSRLPEGGSLNEDLRALEHLLASASAAHARALAAGSGFLSECGALREGFAGLEARLLQKLGGPDDSGEARSRWLAGRPTENSETGGHSGEASEPPHLEQDHVSERSLSSNGAHQTGEGAEWDEVLWPQWRPGLPDMSQSATIRNNWSDFSGADGAERGQLETMAVGLGTILMIDPGSRRRAAWDVLSILLLSYDCIMIPLSVFDVGAGGLWILTEWTVSVFWTFDIFMSFLSGYYTTLGVELRPAKVVNHYLRGTFVFDLFLVLMDWTQHVTEALDGDSVRLVRFGKIVRLTKVFRMIRLLRILKMPTMIAEIVASFQSRALETALGIGQAVALIVVVNHGIACIWYLLSCKMRDTYNQPAWVDLLHAESRDLLYFYTTALHWSVTQFTPASMEVQPRNAAERIFAIVVVFSALMVFSSFISGITTAMTKLREHNRFRHSQLDNLRRYMKEKMISPGLGTRISSFIHKRRLVSHKRAKEKDIEVLRGLPTPLLLQLRFEAHSPVLVQHPFFFQASEYHLEALLTICYRAVSEVSLELSEDVFETGQHAPDMYFLLHGILEYHSSEEAREFDSRTGNCVFCEAALWIDFQHQGRLSCVSTSDFLNVSSGALRDGVLESPDLVEACRSCARQLLDRLWTHSQTRGWDLPLSFDLQQEVCQRAFDAAFQSAKTERRVAKGVSKQDVFLTHSANQRRYHFTHDLACPNFDASSSQETLEGV